VMNLLFFVVLPHRSFRLHCRWVREWIDLAEAGGRLAIGC
jgi:hypothetical protein